MNSQKFSLLIAGSIWVLVGIRIASRGLGWLEPYFNQPDWHLGLLLVSLAIGLGKGLTVLRKTAEARIEKVSEIGSGIKNYLLGWLQLFGPKSLIIIAIMIALGFLLRFLKASGADPFNLFGFLYLGIAIAMFVASSFFFKAVLRKDRFK